MHMSKISKSTTRTITAFLNSKKSQVHFYNKKLIELETEMSWTPNTRKMKRNKVKLPMIMHFNFLNLFSSCQKTCKHHHQILKPITQHFNKKIFKIKKKKKGKTHLAWNGAGGGNWN